MNGVPSVRHFSANVARLLLCSRLAILDYLQFPVLAGTLTIPNGLAPFPAVVLVH
jgi:hypothetical protein